MIENNNVIEIELPVEFSFEQCLVYLNRSQNESLHKVKNSKLYQLIQENSKNYLMEIAYEDGKLKVFCLNRMIHQEDEMNIIRFVRAMFDLDTNIKPFYELAKNDSISESLVKQYRGLRILKIQNIFEGLSWAIIGQQINLRFAYELKKRLVEKYGEKIEYNNEIYYLFPKPQVIQGLQVSDLKSLQFTSRKAEYIIDIAKLICEEEISFENLKNEKDYKSLKKRLIAIRGVGEWTADYVILKCFYLNEAFPIADVGIHNALKKILELQDKPSISEIETMAKKWVGWEAYVAFYLWRSLYD